MIGSPPQNRNKPATLAGIALPPLVIALISVFQVVYSGSRLTTLTLRNGRIVLSSGEYIFDRADPEKSGSVKNIIDGNLQTAAILPFPGPPPEGTYLLIDSALSHWPPAHPGDRPRPRKPAAIRLYNGPCGRCPVEDFRRYSRIRRARIQILNRQANDPDREFLHERTFPIKTMMFDFPDTAGPIDIPLNLPVAPPSPGYPRNVSYIVSKITILEVYPGTEFPGRVAVAEFLYGDRAGEALQGQGGIVYW